MDLDDRLAEDIFLRTEEGFLKLISRSDIATKKTGNLLIVFLRKI